MISSIKRSGNLSASEYLNSWYTLSIFWVLIAVLVSVQDYIDSSINDLGYFIADSLLYKSFWILFIPISIGWIRLVDYLRLRIATDRPSFFILIFFASALIASIHLIAFSVMTSFLSGLLDPFSWSFRGLLLDMISERAYIALAVYLSHACLYSWLKLKEDSPEKNPQIKVKTGKKSFIIPTQEILWISVEDKIIRIKTSSRKYIYGGSLRGILNKVNPDRFKQIHRSTIINVEEVDELKSRLNGDYDVRMKDGVELRLSRNFVKSVRGTLL